MISQLGHDLETCVGCGAQVPRITGPIHRYMTSSPGCWAMFGELTAFLYSGTQPMRHGRLCVDAYAVQHPGGQNPQAIQSVAVHLLSLYAQLELSLPPAAANEVMLIGTQQKGRFHWLPAPSFAGSRTVGHVVASRDRADDAALEWATDAWRAWSRHHAMIATWYGEIAKSRRISE